MKIINLLIASALLAASSAPVFAQGASGGEGTVARERTDAAPGHMETERSASANKKNDPNCRRGEPTTSPEGQPSLHNLPLCDQ